MPKLKTTTILVRKVLTEVPETRNSDMKLYIEIAERIAGREVLNKPFRVVLANLNSLGLPPFETVRRARQKCQEEDATLKAVDSVLVQRELNEEIYKKYAISKV